MGKNCMGFFYGKKYNSGNGTFSLETGENQCDKCPQYIVKLGNKGPFLLCQGFSP